MSDPALVNHRLASGPRYVGMPLGAIAANDEGRAYLQWLAHGRGEVTATDRAIVREFLQLRRKPPPAEPPPAPKPPLWRPRTPGLVSKRSR